MGRWKGGSASTPKSPKSWLCGGEQVYLISLTTLETLSLRPHSRSNNGAKAESLGTRNVCLFKNPVSLSQEKSLANVFQPLAPVGNRKLKLRLFGKTRKLPGHLKPFEVFYWRSSCQWPQPILLNIPCQGKSCVLKRPQTSFSRNFQRKKDKILWKGRYICQAYPIRHAQSSNGCAIFGMVWVVCASVLPRIWSKPTCCLFYPQMMTAKTFEKMWCQQNPQILAENPFWMKILYQNPLFRNIAWLCLISFLLVGLKWSRVWSARASSRTRQSLTNDSPQVVFFTNQLTGSRGYHGTYDVLYILYIYVLYIRIYIYKHHILLYLYGILLIPKKMLM